MRRRAVIAGALAGAAVGGRARAQAPQLPIVGVLSPIAPAEFADNLTAFKRGLAEAGLEDGRDFRLELRFSGGAPERLPALAEEMVALRPRVFIAGSTAGALAARRATREIPVVFIGVGEDPVALGLVESLARPGGNMTGFTLADDLGLVGKRLELLRETAPGIRRVAAFLNPEDATDASIEKALPPAAALIGIEVELVRVRARAELEPAFVAAAARSDGLYVSLSPLFNVNRIAVAALAAQVAKPAVYGFREFAVAGGLLAYGPSLAELYRGATVYVDRILKGEKPATLPVQQPTSFKLVVNLVAAKALGLTLPATLLARADEVIE